MRDHTKLRAFELADDVAVLVYKATRNYSGCLAFSLQTKQPE